MNVIRTSDKVPFWKYLLICSLKPFEVAVGKKGDIKCCKMSPASYDQPLTLEFLLVIFDVG